MAANNVIEAITQVAGSPSLIHGNVARFRVDPTTGGLLCHVVAGGGGIGAGAVTIADGQDFTQGAQADLTATTDTGAFSLVALTKRQLEHLTAIFDKDEEILLELQGLRSVVGNTDDTAAVSDTADATLVAFQKLIAQHLTTLINQGIAAASPVVAALPNVVSVGVASTLVIAANSGRKGLVLTNRSANVISLGFSGAAAVLESGITLDPGDVFVMDARNISTGQVNGIASSAASSLTIQEYL